MLLFFFSSRRRHTRWNCDWSSDVCSSDISNSGDPASFLYGGITPGHNTVLFRTLFSCSVPNALSFFSAIPPCRSGSERRQRKDCGSRAGLPAHAYQRKIGFIALLLHGLLRRCAKRAFVRILRQIAIAANHLFAIHNANQPLRFARVPGNFHLIGTHSYLLLLQSRALHTPVASSLTQSGCGSPLLLRLLLIPSLPFECDGPGTLFLFAIICLQLCVKPFRTPSRVALSLGPWFVTCSILNRRHLAR